MAKRLVLSGDHVCSWIDYEPPALKPDQVRIRTELASGKYGTWSAMLDEATFGNERFDPDLRLFRPVSPGAGDPPPRPAFAFGTTATGVITELGNNVKGFRVGDRVVALDGDIREVNTSNAADVRLLDGLDPRLAMCAEPSYVAFHCVRESNVRYGDLVVVVGLGALGLIAVQMARQSGAGTVVAIDLFAGRRELGRRLGADLTLDPRDGDPALALRQKTGSTGADVAIELSGSTVALNTAIRCARMTGTVCAAGFYRGEARGLFLGRESHHNRLTLIVPHGCGGGHPPRDHPRWDKTRAFDTILAQMRAGRLAVRDIVNPVVGMEEATDLFRRTRDEPDQVVKFAVQF